MFSNLWEPVQKFYKEVAKIGIISDKKTEKC